MDIAEAPPVLSSEDVLVVVSEDGEQISLPVAALPKDFIPGDIVVETLEEQQQEVVVEAPQQESIIVTQVIDANHEDNVHDSLDDNQKIQNQTQQHEQIQESPAEDIQQQKPVRIKQQRKTPLQPRPLLEGDLELVFLDDEEQSNHVEDKRKSRKTYQTKRPRQARRDSKREPPIKEAVISSHIREDSQPDEQQQDDESRERSPECVSPLKLPDHSTKIETTESNMFVERRTRASNACRVATGKNYKCKDCDYSTERLNNIVLHLKEGCQKLKK